jgi:hypothetical protein
LSDSESEEIKGARRRKVNPPEEDEEEKVDPILGHDSELIPDLQPDESEIKKERKRLRRLT